MDLRTGQIYDSLAAATAAGVPESDLAQIHVDDPNAPAQQPTATGRLRMLAELKDCPDVTFSSGPFKGRSYKRSASGQLVRCR